VLQESLPCTCCTQGNALLFSKTGELPLRAWGGLSGESGFSVNYFWNIPNIYHKLSLCRVILRNRTKPYKCSLVRGVGMRWIKDKTRVAFPLIARGFIRWVNFFVFIVIWYKAGAELCQAWIKANLTDRKKWLSPSFGKLRFMRSFLYPCIKPFFVIFIWANLKSSSSICSTNEITSGLPKMPIFGLENSRERKCHQA
jgi:hypothetical protein